MRIVRAIICFLAAWSIAAAPAIAAYAPAWAGMPVVHHHAATAPAKHTHAPHQMTPQNGPEADSHAVRCLHDEHSPAQKSTDPCGAMAACALCYATALPALHFAFAQPLTAAATMSWPAPEQVTAEGPAGLFRPPRA